MDAEDEALSLTLGWKGIDNWVGGCGCIESAAVLLDPLFMLDPFSSDPENKMNGSFLRPTYYYDKLLSKIMLITCIYSSTYTVQPQ